jgi:hypothetical protein
MQKTPSTAEVMPMLDLSPAATVILAGAIVYAAGIGCALWVEWSPTQTRRAEPLSRLDALEEEDTVTLDEPSPHRRN